MRTASLILALFFLIVMGILLLSSFGYAYNYVATRGVVEQVIHYGNGSDTLAIRFQTREGQTVTFQSVGNILPARNVGDSIRVLYNPNHPQEAIDGSFAQLWFYPFLFFWLGVLLIALPIFTSRFNRSAHPLS